MRVQITQVKTRIDVIDWDESLEDLNKSVKLLNEVNKNRGVKYSYKILKNE